MNYTVKGLADLAGVTRRTLHHYDQIGLLKPASTGQNGYRYYDEAGLLRLQQILFYRQLGLSLAEITEIVNRPDFDVIEALQGHHRALRARARRLERQIETVERTIQYLRGEIQMKASEVFSGLSEEQERAYEEGASQRYDAVEVKESYRKWRNYSAEEKARIQQEGAAIYDDLAAHIGEAPDSPQVQAIIARWHQHLRYFYEPSMERLRGLGGLYVDSPDFAGNFRKIHPELPEFFREAIEVYCLGR